MLYMIGLGLCNKKDITLKGLEAIKKCDVVYLEDYTAVFNCNKQELEDFFGKKIILADRDLVENRSDEILNDAMNKDIAFLVIGDPLSATTHIDLFMRAETKGINVKVIHNTSIFNAVSSTGLQLYKFGKVTSIPFPINNIISETPYGVLKMNKNNGLHTLFLLDLKPKEKRFMNVKDAIDYLIKIENKRNENLFNEDTLCLGCARIGCEDETIKFGKAKDISKIDFGKPMYCLIVPGKLHFMEEEFLNRFKVK